MLPVIRRGFRKCINTIQEKMKNIVLWFLLKKRSGINQTRLVPLGYALDPHRLLERYRAYTWYLFGCIPSLRHAEIRPLDWITNVSLIWIIIMQASLFKLLHPPNSLLHYSGPGSLWFKTYDFYNPIYDWSVILQLLLAVQAFDLLGIQDCVRTQRNSSWAI